MLKRTCVLIGTTAFGFVALLGLMWLMSSPSPAAHAYPNKLPSDTTTNMTLHCPTHQIIPSNCITKYEDITSSDTWTHPCYLVMTNTVTIHAGASLIISPPVTGTRVYFQAGAQLQVLGNLYVSGTVNRPITFTSANINPSPGDWVGIILDQDSGGDHIEYSVIEFAQTGLKINDEDYVRILSNTFRCNDDSATHAGAIGGDTDGSRIANNRIYSCTNGIILGESFENEIISNTIHNITNTGIALVKGVGPGGDENNLSGNTIHHCSQNGIRLEDGSQNVISGNLIFLNDNEGIYLSEQKEISVTCNHVYSNGNGSSYRAAVYITGSDNLAHDYPNLSRNVIYDEHGDAIEYAISNSSLSPSMPLNALCSIPGYELNNNDSVTINAPHNWWGTNTPTAGVNYTKSVALDPWIVLSLTGSADGIVTVTLRDRDGHTAPPPPTRQTTPPAPNARRIELTTPWGILSPTVVVVDDWGVTTVTLSPSGTPAPDPIILTATDFCGYPVTSTIGFPNPIITKTTDITWVVPGGLVTYTIAYSNTGDADAQNVVLTDDLPPGTRWYTNTALAVGWTTRTVTTSQVVWFTPTLRAGASGSFLFVLHVSETVACGTRLTNTVTITTATLERDPGDNQDTDDSVTVLCTDLAITKTADPPEGPLYAPISSTIVYSNNSPITVTNAVITDWLPTDTRYVTDTSGLPIFTSTGHLTWTVASLAPRSAYSFTLTLNYTSTVCPVTLTNTVTISSALPETIMHNNWATATYRALCAVDFTVIKDDNVGPTSPMHTVLAASKQAAVDRLLRTSRGPTPLALTRHREFVYEGDIVTYTIAVVNTSPYTATNLVLSETLPLYTSYVGDGWTHLGGRTYITTVNELPPDDGRIFYFVVQVDSLLPDGVNNLVNHVCGQSDEFDTHLDDNCNYEDTPVRRRPLRVSKNADACIAPGDMFDYYITYRNITTSTAFYHVVLTDTPDFYVSCVGGPEWHYNGQVCTRTIPVIPSSTTGALRLSAQLSATFPYTLRTTITNVVEISGGNRFVLTSPVDISPNLSVVKNDNVGPLPLAQQMKWEAMAQRLSSLRQFSLLQTEGYREFVRPGELITYTILYVNAGISTTTGVVLTETLPADTSYVSGGWSSAGDRRYTLYIGDLEPGQGGEAHFVVQVNDPFPLGVERVINRVDIGGEQPECDRNDNWSADDTPVRTDLKLYVANLESGTVDVFNTFNFDYVTAISVGGRPFGMAVSGTLLYVANDNVLQIVDMINDTITASASIGQHPIHVGIHKSYVYVAIHEGQVGLTEGLTVIGAREPFSTAARLSPNLYRTYDFGFFGVTVDEKRDLIYTTKRDYGSLGLWTVTPLSNTLSHVFPTDERRREKPCSIVYNPHTDRVYVSFALLDELWVFDPDSWGPPERIPTEHQDPVEPSDGGKGLIALGGCVFASNYLSRSVTAVVNGSCVESLGASPAPPPAGPHRVYLPLVGKNFATEQIVLTIRLQGHPKGIAAAGNLLFVTLPPENKVAIIDTETMSVIREIAVPGEYPHTVTLGGGDYFSPLP